jgi:hypothetical protein
MKTQVEQYIKMRNENQYSIEWFYNYYRNHSKHNIDIKTFEGIFRMSNFDSIVEHIDRKFGLDVLTDKDGKFIKCYLSPSSQD